jgi:hypothetical protein
VPEAFVYGFGVHAGLQCQGRPPMGKSCSRIDLVFCQAAGTSLGCLAALGLRLRCGIEHSQPGRGGPPLAARQLGVGFIHGHRVDADFPVRSRWPFSEPAQS